MQLGWRTHTQQLQYQVALEFSHIIDCSKNRLRDSVVSNEELSQLSPEHHSDSTLNCMQIAMTATRGRSENSKNRSIHVMQHMRCLCVVYRYTWFALHVKLQDVSLPVYHILDICLHTIIIEQLASTNAFQCMYMYCIQHPAKYM